MAITKERKEQLRKLHTDNRYGVLELLEEIESLEDQLQWSIKNEEQYKTALREIKELEFE